MKKTFLIFLLAGLCACSNESGDQSNDASAASDSKESKEVIEKRRQDSLAAAALSSEKEKGIELIAASDCLTCHKVEEKHIGPAYRDVANKYTNDDATKEKLADKIIKGGSGVWGTVPMTPHPQVTKEDAKTMVGYILSLKQ